MEVPVVLNRFLNLRYTNFLLSFLFFRLIKYDHIFGNFYRVNLCCMTSVKMVVKVFLK